MAEPPSSPSSSTTKKKKISMNKSQHSGEPEEADPCFIAAMNHDLLQNILSRLPAKSFAFASCVSRSWNDICGRILSRPKILSAFYIDPDKRRAAKEVLDKVLSEPIRPDFVIANVTGDVGLVETLKLIVERVGSRVPIIVSRVAGILGKEACSDKFREVKWGDLVDGDTFAASDDVNPAILMTIGYVPGLKVDVIPVIQAKKEPEAAMGDKFVMDIRKYVSTVSDQAAPVGMILFGAGNCDMKPIIEKLEYAMPGETFILGDERGEFVCNSLNELRNARLSRSRFRVKKSLCGLVFARDRHRTSRTVEIQFHTVISSGVSPVGPRYKAVSVRVSDLDSSTFLTARREGGPEILDGQQILDDINNLLENHTEVVNPYIGVIKRRNCSIGSEKPKLITSLLFHEVTEGDEHSLTVEGAGIRTGDYFQFYYSNPKAALASVSNASSQLRNLKTQLNNSADGKQTEFFGGFVFSCYGRGESFFGRPNTDSSPFLENLPDLPFGGIFCGGEIGRSSSFLPQEEEEESGRGDIMVRQCLHVYSTVYLLMSYSPPPC